ncbi:GDP-L-fucose synthase [Acidimicrobiaceae bacterium]|nr:GDP-L-fucose synthase [Acidimicrobiaceae bacterium]|tara:strand:- start:9678 stop:10607 length:930 start_codon:yes stop_codon:yes gene_type:complete
MTKNNVLVFGSNGLVGSSCVRILSKSPKISKVIASTRNDTNLFNYQETKQKIENSKPDVVIIAAAKVGGILANNTYRSEFLLENLKINMNILESLIDYPNVQIINLGSSCIYPLNAENPINEDSIFSGKLEPTNSPYAVAKLSAIELADAMSKQFNHRIYNLMPTNLYGPNDNFSELDSHVIPGLIRRMHDAKILKKKEFEIWGTGKPLREFLYVDDLSLAIEFLIDKDIDKNVINVGSSEEISIKELAQLIQELIEFEGELVFDESKPDGNPRKLLDSSYLSSLGWEPKTTLNEGLNKSYEWFLSSLS